MVRPMVLLSRARIPAEERFDLRRAIGTGWTVTLASAWPAMFVTGLFLLGAFLTLLSVVGIFMVGPILAWGYTAFLLASHEGRGRVVDAFSGFSIFREAWPPFALFLLLIFLLGLPANIVQQLASSFESPLIRYLGHVMQVALTFFVTVRLYFAPFFIVDQSLNFRDAVVASWHATGRQRGQTALLALVTGIIALTGFMGVGIGLLFTMPLGYAVWTAAYREMYPPRSS